MNHLAKSFSYAMETFLTDSVEILICAVAGLAIYIGWLLLRLGWQLVVWAWEDHLDKTRREK